MAMSKITMKVRKTDQLPPLTIPGSCIEARSGPNIPHHGLDLENAFPFSTETFPYESEFVNFFNILSPGSSISIFPDLTVNRNGFPDFIDLSDPEAIHDGPNEAGMRNTEEIDPDNMESDLNTTSGLFCEDNENDEIDVVSLEESVIQLEDGKFDESFSHYIIKQEEYYVDDAGLDSNFEVPSPESGIQEVCGVDNCLNYNNVVNNPEEDHSFYKNPVVPPVLNLEVGTRKRKISHSYVDSLSDRDNGNNDDVDDDNDDDDEDYKYKYTCKKKKKVLRKPYTRKKKPSSNSYDSDAAEEDCTDTGTYMSKRKREQNKRAATKYRNKKKLEEVENMNRLQELMETNKELKNIVKSREHEVKVMRQLLLEVMRKK